MRPKFIYESLTDLFKSKSIKEIIDSLPDIIHKNTITYENNDIVLNTILILNEYPFILRCFLFQYEKSYGIMFVFPSKNKWEFYDGTYINNIKKFNNYHIINSENYINLLKEVEQILDIKIV